MKNRDSKEFLRRFKNTLTRRYILRRELSRGGDDVTLFTYDRKSKKNKIVRFFNFADTPNITLQKILNDFDRFKIKEVSQHTNILTINEINVFSDMMNFDYIGLDADYFDCVSLEERAINYIPMFERYRIIYSILSALLHCHEYGLFHQNVGPQNIFVSEKEVKLSEPSSWVIPLHHCYSIYKEYEAPEFKKGNIANEQTEIYSVGKVFKYLNTINGDSNNIADMIIQKATAFDAAARFKSIFEFKQEVSKLIELSRYL